MRPDASDDVLGRRRAGPDPARRGRRGGIGLDQLLADDVAFHSPVVHTPQRGWTAASDGWISA
jgi:hypothetical protein